MKSKDDSGEFYWNLLKGPLLQATDRNCECTEGPARHKETGWGNDDASNSVSEKRKLWKKWKQGNTRRKIQRQRKKPEGLLTRQNIEQKGKEMEIDITQNFSVNYVTSISL